MGEVESTQGVELARGRWSQHEGGGVSKREVESTRGRWS